MEVKHFKYFLNFLYLIFQYNFAKIICNESKEQQFIELLNKDKINQNLTDCLNEANGSLSIFKLNNDMFAEKERLLADLSIENCQLKKIQDVEKLKLEELSGDFENLRAVCFKLEVNISNCYLRVIFLFKLNKYVSLTKMT